MPRDRTAPAETDIDARAASRARREERRAKQREQNVGRAHLMHIARLEHARAHRLNNEPSPPPTVIESTAPGSLVSRVGCSGWYYWHWGGTFYPHEIPRTSWFQHY